MYNKARLRQGSATSDGRHPLLQKPGTTACLICTTWGGTSQPQQVVSIGQQSHIVNFQEEEADVTSHCTYGLSAKHFATWTLEGSFAIPLEPGPCGYQLCQFPVGLGPWSPRYGHAQVNNTYSLRTSLPQGFLHCLSPQILREGCNVQIDVDQEKGIPSSAIESHYPSQMQGSLATGQSGKWRNTSLPY